MLKLQPAMTVPAAKSVPAAKLFPATKVESAPVKSAVVGYPSRLPPDPLLHPPPPPIFTCKSELCLLCVAECGPCP